MIMNCDGTGIPDHTHVCIVGAGPIGLALAFKCAEKGLSVTILEAGGVDRASDNPPDLGAVDVTTSHHAKPNLTVHRGLGGSSRKWGGRCVAMDDIDFEKRDHVPSSGWPIVHGELVAYYREAFEFLGCGNAGEIALATEIDDDISAHRAEAWSQEPDIVKFHGDRLHRSALIKVYINCAVTGIELDQAGTGVAGLNIRTGSRASKMRAGTYVLAGGGLENARLLLLAQRDWPGKFGGPDGALGRYYAGHLTGYLAAIRLNEPELARELWFRECKDGSILRQRLTITADAQKQHKLLNAAFWLESFSLSDPAHGSGALSSIYVGLRLLGLYPRIRTGLAPQPISLQPHTLRQHFDNLREDPSLLTSTWRVMSELASRRSQRRMALANPRSRYLLRYHAEQIASRQNRVRLGGGPASPPSLVIDYRFEPADAESVVASHLLLDEWLQRKGIGRLDYLVGPGARNDYVLEQAIDGYHQIGLTRMSDDPKHGVVDRNCRVHDVTNLFVAGSSVFPTSGQANPTLPAVALALRLADHLKGVSAAVPAPKFHAE